MTFVPHPREPNAAYRVGQHVTKNRRKRISRWEVRVKPRMLPMRDLEEHLFVSFFNLQLHKNPLKKPFNEYLGTMNCERLKYIQYVWYISATAFTFLFILIFSLHNSNLKKFVCLKRAPYPPF